ncbi:MAG: hypothetical protein HRU38_07030 [Saccharospirillaceae bacterium]|nr:hypothetical protein [Saccharospirillaceae bacterium]
MKVIIESVLSNDFAASQVNTTFKIEQTHFSLHFSLKGDSLTSYWCVIKNDDNYYHMDIRKFTLNKGFQLSENNGSLELFRDMLVAKFSLAKHFLQFCHENDVLFSQTASRWLKEQLAVTKSRDPVDALNDAIALVKSLELRLHLLEN